MTELRAGLPELPPRMRLLPIDERGYPVPYFVAWVDGNPDHRVADFKKMPGAVKVGLCWMCGAPLGRFKSFAIGPMCAITRNISEPPSHLDCLRFAVRACPWMTRPKAKRREANLPDGVVDPAGDGLKRNPGVICIWTTLRFKPWPPAGGGVLFEIGNPEHTEWWAEGRSATRAEVDESISSGLPSVRVLAEKEDTQNRTDVAQVHLDKCVARETAWLDAQVWPEAIESVMHEDAS